ncbi:MAG: cytochrome P450 [Sphingomonadales bacterium]|nr:cytochrome P450 [Sphingomonadales bacterium]
MSKFEKVDFFTDAALVDDPVPYYEYLHEQGPVIPLPERDCVAVVGFDECVQVFRDTVNFSSVVSPTGPIPALPFDPEGDDIGEQIERYRAEMPYAGQIVTLDPPVHSASRSLLMRLFTPSRLKANEAYMIEASDHLIDEFADEGACEVVTQYGGPFATMVIADLLGVPMEDRPELRRILSPEVREKLGAVPGQLGVKDKPPVAFDFLRDTFVEYVRERLEHPHDDVLSELALATMPDGSRPDPMEVVRLTTFLFAAGQDTTARFLASALRIIAENPWIEERLRGDRLLIPEFIEESMRLEGPTKSEGRLVKVSTTLGGVHLPAGTPLTLILSAVNRDPRRFEAPNEFRFGRPRPMEHLGFGRGAHTCAGAPLARAESKVSLGRFLDRFSNIRISEEHHGPPGNRQLEYAPTYVFRGLKRLHLDLESS